MRLLVPNLMRLNEIRQILELLPKLFGSEDETRSLACLISGVVGSG